jgi:hypothetical protein
MDEAIASRTAPALCPATAEPCLTLGSPWPSMRGGCSSMVNRVVRSTRVPVAERNPGNRYNCHGSLRAAEAGGPGVADVAGEGRFTG